MAWRREETRCREQTHCRDAVGVKIPIKNWERSARMITQHSRIEGKARKHNHEQNDTCQAQSRMRDATKQPAKRCAFQGPAHCDPLSIKLDRENQRDEEQRCASKQRELRISSRARDRRAFEPDKKSAKRGHRTCQGYETRDAARITAADDFRQQ